MQRTLVAVGLTAAVASALAQVPAAQLAKPPANARHFVIQSTGGKHGDSWTWVSADGTRMGRESMNLRGQVFELDAAGLTNRQAMHAALSKPENRYRVRKLCWVMTIEGLETYILVPRDAADFQLLVDAVRSTPSPIDMDAVIGVRRPMAPPDMCNGLMVPIVAFDQIYSFDRDSLLKAIPAPKKEGGKQFAAAASELFDRIMLLADNAGATDDHRAVNYLALRYPAIYHTAAEMFEKNASLSAVEVRPSSLSGTRRIVDVVFTYTHRQTDVDDKYFCRVDVSEEFPFLVTKLSPYYDRASNGGRGRPYALKSPGGDRSRRRGRRGGSAW